MKRFALGVLVFAVVFWVWLVPYLIGRLMPVSYYVSDIALVVHDAAEGDPVPMSLARVVHRDFDAAFVSQVRMDSAAGPLVAGCEGETTPVRSLAGSPPAVGLTLHRWLGYPPCSLEPGKYVLVSEARIQGPLGSTVRVPIVTNVFKISKGPK